MILDSENAACTCLVKQNSETPPRAVLSGYYIIQLVARNLASRASVIAGRDTTTAGCVFS